MDPDQDLLDKLDRQEGLSPYSATGFAAALAVLAGGIAFCTLKLEMDATTEAAVDAAILFVITTGALLALCYSRFR